jgi:hypothetical protein
MSNNATFDASIPVLTEVFQDHPIAEELKPAAVEAPAPAPVDPDAGRAAGTIGDSTGPEWEQLERRLSERIVQQLQGRVDFALGQRLQDSMREALEAAMAGLTDQVRRSLQESIETIVARAVAEELAHLQSLEK